MLISAAPYVDDAPPPGLYTAFPSAAIFFLLSACSVAYRVRRTLGLGFFVGWRRVECAFLEAVTSSIDGCIRFWDLETGEQTALEEPGPGE